MLLGVTSGLGYAIKDARETLSYDHLTAMVLTIGARAIANTSGRCIANRFAVSSLSTIEKNEIRAVTTTVARPPAKPFRAKSRTTQSPRMLI